MPRIIRTEELIPIIANLVRKACCSISPSYLEAIRRARTVEESPYGREALDLISENAAFAERENLPCCQDTGTCIVFLEIGEGVAWQGGLSVREAVNAGVASGYTEGFLRKSIVGDPLGRINTGDNTPAVLHTELVPGDKLRITVLPKGGGCENMSAFTTLLPSAGEEGVADFVVRTVDAAGGKPCPPLVVGLGIGGTADLCALLAKKAVLRPVGQSHPDAKYAALEQILLERINALGIGPFGTGGRCTALAVHIETFACHITALPVAINFQCHAARTGSAVL